MNFSLIPFLAQVKLEGLEEASQSSLVSGVLVAVLLVTFGVLVYIGKLFLEKNKEVKDLGKEYAKELKEIGLAHTKEIKELSEKHADALDRIRIELQKRDDDRYQKSLASEKEMIEVLGGVNTVMDLSNKLSEKDNKVISQKLDAVLNKLENFKKDK